MRGSFPKLGSTARTDPDVSPAADPSGSRHHKAWTVTETARRLGVSRSAVSHAIRRGRVQATRDAKGRPWLDPEAVSMAWTPRRMPGLDDQVVSDVRPHVEAIWASRARREAAEAQRAMLQAAMLQGQLCAVPSLQQAVALAAQQLREGLLALPSRLAPVIAGLRDPIQIEKLLYQELSTTVAHIDPCAGLSIVSLSTGEGPIDHGQAQTTSGD